ncbi:hypothetical protein PtB15_17B259 [Puccinia triticina]|nr:hypothetical protein PtB15_17B259 [Puccinia triticina]
MNVFGVEGWEKWTALEGSLATKLHGGPGEDIKRVSSVQAFPHPANQSRRVTPTTLLHPIFIKLPVP